ncbi:hypothetical protein EI94DRAFT_418210 [Lactarius quietus]|nr:hypothetical protein EI94DRAFT_418210 [Lactarius quietus]
MRALVVGNSTLATIAVQYRLPDHLRLHIAQSVTLKASTHVQGLIVFHLRALPTHKADVFESYVGGLYKDQGLSATKAWLDKLFTPYVKSAYRIVREQHGLPPLGVSNELQAVTGVGTKPPTPPPETPRMGMATTTLGHLGLFNQRLQQQSNRSSGSSTIRSRRVTGPRPCGLREPLSVEPAGAMAAETLRRQPRTRQPRRASGTWVLMR